MSEIRFPETTILLFTIRDDWLTRFRINIFRYLLVIVVADFFDQNRPLGSRGVGHAFFNYVRSEFMLRQSQYFPANVVYDLRLVFGFAVFWYKFENRMNNIFQLKQMVYFLFYFMFMFSAVYRQTYQERVG